jgi:hypothetical protein
VVTLEVGKVEPCPSCGKDVRVHDVGKDVDDEALKRLLSTVKLVERVKPSQDQPSTDPPAPKRPWWKFWA